MLFEKLAKNISDIPGVEGLCLFELGGQALFNRMPAFVPETALEEAQRRIQALYETIDENFLPADDYLLRFAGRSLLLRRLGGTILLLLTDERANPMSLRMVTNMVLKHLQTSPELLAELRSASPRVTETSQGGQDSGAAKGKAGLPAPGAAHAEVSKNGATAGVATAAPVPPTKHLRVYRGQILTD